MAARLTETTGCQRRGHFSLTRGLRIPRRHRRRGGTATKGFFVGYIENTAMSTRTHVVERVCANSLLRKLFQ